ncbi:uncharacterized protein IL334_002630 [Kwoniella shivajii]|uniref:HhH-GPD domain-containing protein n=1 Tax=Kwoniella shivajii TaxID=564305 RepID=A0ABZ1CVM0_9TREE|nr:hypothetical protein IL334_002630 [Kwoniella shivajii]
MAPKSKSTASSTGGKRKRPEVKDEVEDTSSGDDFEDEDEQDSLSDHYESPPTKTKKTNGKSKTTPTKPSGKKTPKSSSKSSSSTKAKSDTKESTKPEPKGKSSAKAKTAAQPTKSRQKLKDNSALLKYLLSDEALDYANPSPKHGYGEADWASHTSPSNPKTAPEPLPKPSASKSDQVKSETEHPAMKKGIRYPHSPMTPFQTLVCCLILSKPLSHKLGIRTISTLLNPPYNFGEFSVLEEADETRCLEALWKARTQHKEKTAVQFGDLVDGVRGLNGEGEEDSLNGIKRAIEGLPVDQAQKRVGDMLRSIKYIGPVGVGIFLRRIQGQWKEVFPYVDERCLGAAKAIGLIGENEGAEEMGKLAGGDGANLVRLLDTLIGLDLEKGKLDEVAERYS